MSSSSLAISSPRLKSWGGIAALLEVYSFRCALLFSRLITFHFVGAAAGRCLQLRHHQDSHERTGSPVVVVDENLDDAASANKRLHIYATVAEVDSLLPLSSCL
ncbi:unnamed protein product [Musa textilis]